MTTAGMRATSDRVRARPDVPGHLLRARPGNGCFRLGPVRAEPEPEFRAGPVIAACCSKGIRPCR